MSDDRIRQPKSVGELMDILRRMVIDGQGFVHSGGLVYVFTKDGTKIYTEEEFAEIDRSRNGRDNTCK